MFLIIFFFSPEIVTRMLTQMLMAALVTNLTYQNVFIMDTIFFFWDVTAHKYFRKFTVSCKYVLLSSLLSSEEHFFSYFVSVDCRKTFYSLLNVTSIL